MSMIRLNDGTEIDGGYCVLQAENQLGLYIPGKSLAEGFAMLSDTFATGVISAEQYGQETTYTGFTHLFSLREEPGGMLSAGLKRG